MRVCADPSLPLHLVSIADWRGRLPLPSARGNGVDSVAIQRRFGSQESGRVFAGLFHVCCHHKTRIASQWGTVARNSKRATPLSPQRTKTGVPDIRRSSFFYYFQCIFVYWLILRPCCMHTETTQIIKHMMSPNAADRPTIDELLAYKFLGRCAMYFCASYRPEGTRIFTYFPSLRLQWYWKTDAKARRQNRRIAEEDSTASRKKTGVVIKCNGETSHSTSNYHLVNDSLISNKPIIMVPICFHLI